MAGIYDAGSTSERFDALVATVAAGQFGVISRRQAFDAGGTSDQIRHRRRSGRWWQAARDVFVVSGYPRSWHQDLMVACLAWGDGATVSHRSAAALAELPGVDPIVELTVPATRRRVAPGTIHRSALADVDRIWMGPLPVTTMARTLIDLAAVAPRATVARAVDEALRRGEVSLSRLAWRLDELGRRPGSAVMRDVIDERRSEPVTASELEARLYRLLRVAGVPLPVAQYPVKARGRLIGVVDFAWPNALLAVEADGFRWHSGRVRWEHDRARRNELTQAGWRVLHVTWTSLTHDGPAVVDLVRSALAREAPSSGQFDTQEAGLYDARSTSDR